MVKIKPTNDDKGLYILHNYITIFYYNTGTYNTIQAVTYNIKMLRNIYFYHSI